MSGTLSVRVSMHTNHNGAGNTLDVGFTTDISNKDIVSNTITVTAVEAQITDIASPGYVYMKNHGMTNNVYVGSETGVYHIDLKPGDFAFFQTSAQLFVVTNTGTTTLEYLIIEA